MIEGPHLVVIRVTVEVLRVLSKAELPQRYQPREALRIAVIADVIYLLSFHPSLPSRAEVHP